jgi:hypothetical protein
MRIVAATKTQSESINTQSLHNTVHRPYRALPSDFVLAHMFQPTTQASICRSLFARVARLCHAVCLLRPQKRKALIVRIDTEDT